MCEVVIDAILGCWVNLEDMQVLNQYFKTINTLKQSILQNNQYFKTFNTLEKVTVVANKYI